MDTNDTRTPKAAFLDPEPAVTAEADQPQRGHRRRWWLFVAALAIFAVVFDRPGGAPVGWGEDFDAALAQARAQHRQVLVAFHGAGCPPCHVMERTVLGRPAVREALVDFVPVRIDPNNRADLAGRYSIFATPTYVVVGADAALIHQVVGPQSVDEFVAFLQTSLGMAANTRSPGS